MSLKYALLGSLSMRPMSGYDIKKFFERSVGLIWNANYSQIYSHLKRLEEEGLLKKETVVQNGKPNKIVYSLTDRGMSNLRSWLAEPIFVADTKDQFILRFFFSDLLEKDKLKEHLLKAKELIKKRKEVLERVTHNEIPSISRITLQAAKMGERFYREYISWIDETLELLEKGELYSKRRSLKSRMKKRR